MSTIETWSYTKSDMEESFDRVKTIVVRALVEEGALDEKLADEWCAEHTVILAKKGFFRTITDRWSKDKRDESSYLLKVVRSVI